MLLHLRQLNELSVADATVESAPLRLRRDSRPAGHSILYVAGNRPSKLDPLAPIRNSANSGWVNVSAQPYSAAIFVVPGPICKRRAFRPLQQKARCDGNTLSSTDRLPFRYLSGLSGSYSSPAIVFAGGNRRSPQEAPAVLALQWDYFGRRHFGVLFGIQSSVVALVSSHRAGTRRLRLRLYIGEGPRFVFLWVILPLAIALVLILLIKRPQSAAPNPPTAKAEPQVA